MSEGHYSTSVLVVLVNALGDMTVGRSLLCSVSSTSVSWGGSLIQAKARQATVCSVCAMKAMPIVSDNTIVAIILLSTLR
jgi:hypothetical protein